MPVGAAVGVSGSELTDPSGATEVWEPRSRLSLERYSAVTVEPTVKPAASATSEPMRTSPGPGQWPVTSQCPLRVRTRSTSIPASM